VTQQGVVTALRSGNPIVTAVCDRVEGRVRLTTLAPVSKIGIWTDGRTEPLRAGWTTQLSIAVERADISFGACTTAATWQSSNDAVAAVNAGGLLIARSRGEATITASCDGKTATRTFRVVEGLTLSGLLIDADLSMILDRGEVEVLDGPQAGYRTGAGLGGFAIHEAAIPLRIRASSPGYQPTELIVTEASSQSLPDQNIVYVTPRLRLAPEPGAEDFIGEAVAAGPIGGARHTFRVGRSGTFRAQTWWSLDYNDGLALELRCGSRVLLTAHQHEQSYGQGFETLVEPCDVDLILRPSKPSSTTRYRLRVRYPR
jgi:hypothetical protein